MIIKLIINIYQKMTMIITAEIWHTGVERDQGYRLFFKYIQWSSPSLSSRSEGDYVQGWAQGRGRDSALEYRLKRWPKSGEKLFEEKKSWCVVSHILRHQYSQLVTPHLLLRGATINTSSHVWKCVLLSILITSSVDNEQTFSGWIIFSFS